MKALKYLNYIKGILIYFGVTLITELVLIKIPFPKNFWVSNLVNLISPTLTSIIKKEKKSILFWPLTLKQI